MATSANVQNIEALKAFRVSLCKFVEAARGCLGEAEADLQRHANWLAEDRMRHWRTELTKRTEKFRQAKMALLEKKLQKTAGGGRPSCVDEEKALARATALLEEAQRKGANTKRWIRQLDEEIFQYKGLIQALNHALDVDFAKMLNMLDGMMEALDRYVLLAPPPGLESPEPQTAMSDELRVASPAARLNDETPPADETSQQSPELSQAKDSPAEGAA